MISVKIHMVSSNAMPSINWGTLMHGMLMERLRGAWPYLLHEGNVRAMTQWIEPINQRLFIWHVHFLNDHLGSNFLEICQPGDEWFCQHNGSKMTVANVEAQETTLFEYSRKFAENPQAGRFVTIHFKTPTTHKSQGKYVLFPSVELIVHSIRNRIASIDEAVEPSEELVNRLVLQTEIRNYQLRTAVFGLEGSWVRGYLGSLMLSMKGDPNLLSFGRMYFGLAEWFGIGIKTTLGMGGCIVSTDGKER